jgi:hypothetical protein
VITAYDIYGNESSFSNELSHQPSLPQPSLPTANDDTATVVQDSGTSNIDVIKNDDFGADGPAAADITITSLPANASAAVNNGSTPNHPVDDSIDYTPNQNFTGTDTVSYKICDSNNDCDTAVLTVTVTDNSTPGKRNQFLYDEAGQRLQVLTGDDIGLSFSHVLPASSIGTFSIDFLPTIKYSMSGIMCIRLLQDLINYYEIRNADGSDPGEIKKVVNGKIVERDLFQNEYVQNKNYHITIDFSPLNIMVDAYGEVHVLNADTSGIIVNSFQVYIFQQDAYFDNILFNK